MKPAVKKASLIAEEWELDLILCIAGLFNFLVKRSASDR